MKKALIAGSTGLVGSQLLKLLLDSDRYGSVVALTRTELSITHPKLIQVRIDYTQIDKYASEIEADDVFCCLGTTLAKARSKEKFREVDFTYPLELAELASAKKASQFLVVSALGADRKSSFYYNRVKGELEEAIVKINFQGIHIFQPTLLLGPRAEHRPAEEAAKIFYKIFWFLLPGKFQAIHAVKVAKAMLYYASRDQHGIFIHEAREMQRFND
jgi:uncharacterized protein YbjT (DUF2867 family)